ncbi:high mobility group box-domain-containing protein [Chaetomium tenue]|uniref:High mobility group box-domain-containing protein n=1 Tax=Chaetomium tenue TaxID=1854479 RepID=A0ACB7P3Y6_9PEZI|nr:high mobility group box-domain-containing protein [Chaetomium globosum]
MASRITGTNLTAIEDASPLAFVFNGNEMIVQCTANIDDEAGAINILSIALENFKNFNDGKHAVIVRPKDSTQYWITSAPYAETLDKNVYQVIKSTEISISMPNSAPEVPTGPQGVKHQKISKLRIRRPRNQFIIYRQWMSAKIHASNPRATAACISQIVAQTWQAEKADVKARFKALADEEDRIHKEMYPGYRYVAGRRNPQLPLSKRNLTRDPMTVAERLIAAGL